MEEPIIGRAAEKKALENMLTSNETELIAILGRRRLGKTFLIRNFYRQQLVFECTGIHDARLNEPLLNFSSALQQSMKLAVPLAAPASWTQAF